LNKNAYSAYTHASWDSFLVDPNAGVGNQYEKNAGKYVVKEEEPVIPLEKYGVYDPREGALFVGFDEFRRTIGGLNIEGETSEL